MTPGLAEWHVFKLEMRAPIASAGWARELSVGAKFCVPRFAMRTWHPRSRPGDATLPNHFGMILSFLFAGAALRRTVFWETGHHWNTGGVNEHRRQNNRVASGHPFTFRTYSIESGMKSLRVGVIERVWCGR